MDLRDYQNALVNNARERYAAGKRAVLIQLPTGGGKTALTCHGVIKVAAARGSEVLVLVHRAEIRQQFCAALELERIAHGVIAPNHPRTRHRVQVASVQTAVRRLDSMAIPKLIVIDEAHHARAKMWRAIVAAYPRAHLLGLTATPQRLDGKGLGKPDGLFDALVCGPQMQWLIDHGFLARPRVFAAQCHVDLSTVETVRGDFDTAGAEGRMMEREIIGDAVEQYRRRLDGRRAVAFCTTLDHAAAQAAAFNAVGIRAERIDGELTPQYRANMLERFATGRTKVLCSVSLIEEGFDLPAIDGAILLRPTQSMTIFLQQIGRALRMAPGKDEAIILDHVGNTLRHGHPTDDREWTLEGRTRRRENQDQAKRCEHCFAINPINARLCVECGRPFRADRQDGTPRTAIEQRDGELVELTPELRARLRRNRIEEERQAARQGLDALRLLADRRGYSPGWAARRHAAYIAARARRNRRY